MSSNKFGQKFAEIRFDPTGAFISGGLSRDDQVALVPRLEAARCEIESELEKWRSTAVAAGQGGAAAIIDLPERMLGDYRQRRGKSELGRILATAKRLREAVDRVVVLGSNDDCLAARALFEACCHPYHNEQGRGDRGGRPRIYFAGSDFDNDALQGLRDLLERGRKSATIDDRWGLIVLDSNGATLEISAIDEPGGVSPRISLPTAVALQALGRNAEIVEIAKGYGSPDRAGGPAAVFSAIGLLPGSVMGLDIVRLLEGAVAMNERFRSAPIGDNPALDLAGVCQLMRQTHATTARRFVTWGRGLRAAARWYRRLCEQFEISNFKSQISDLNVNLVVESVRRDRIVVEPTESADDPLNHLACKTLHELNLAAIRAAKAANTDAGHPAVDIRLPALDEATLGQLFQMLLLATMVERQCAR